MTISERIFQTIEEKRLKTSELAKRLEISQSVITNWKKRKTTPPMEYTLVICEFLNVSIEYLITGKETDNLNLEEQQLLEAYRNAELDMKRAARKILDAPELPGKSSASLLGEKSI